MLLFREDKFTLGKQHAIARTIYEQQAVLFAKEYRFRKLPVIPRNHQDTHISVLQRQHNGNPWIVTLNYAGGRTLTTNFETGSAILNPPSFWEVLHCLLMDISGIEELTFDEWCADLGYNPDSRTAEKLFNRCRDTLPLVRRLLGRDFAEIRLLDEDELRERFKNVITFRQD
jgi:hypothetical protein